MVKVTYCRKDHCLTINGHALSGEAGHDLVCAGISTLAYTLANFVYNSVSFGSATDHIVRLENGYAEISCKAKRSFRATITLGFDNICAGFDILARRYPDNVKFEEINYTRDRKEKDD